MKIRRNPYSRNQFAAGRDGADWYPSRRARRRFFWGQLERRPRRLPKVHPGADPGFLEILADSCFTADGHHAPASKVGIAVAAGANERPTEAGGVRGRSRLKARL